MEASLERRLRLGATSLGIVVDDRIVSGLDRYLDLLLFWNRRVNLTAVRDPEGVIERHFVDSLAVLPHLPAAGTLADVGSGPGFPGAVLALARPDLSVALIDSHHKKAAFLEALRRDLPLPNVTVHAQRVEDWSAAHRPGPDVVVSRATWDVASWLERGRHVVRPGGLVLGMEGGTLRDLPSDAERHPYPHPHGRRAIIVLRAA
jgi:16S rRNA (guanine527-N7)-methyltransferase